MEARAIVRNVRMTPRKIKLICDLIRGKDAGEAMAIIMNTPKAACEPMEKLLKRPGYEARYAACTGPCISNPQENLAHHAGSWRERIREGNQWARK